MLTTSAVIALAIMGDSFLYGVLPLEAQSLGLTLPMVGLLLSANRLVRLASNTWVSGWFERLGPQRPFVWVALLGLLTTALYGLPGGFLLLLLARIGWGIAWSGLRQGGYQAVWSGDEAVRGRLMGLMWGIVRLGSAVGVLVGGFVRDRLGYGVAVGAITGIGALALPLLLTLRWPPQGTAQTGGRPGSTARLQEWGAVMRRPAQAWLVLSGFAMAVTGATLVATAALLLNTRVGAEPLSALGLGLGTLSGALLAVRWSAGLLVGPAIGALADRVGRTRMALLLTGGLFLAMVGAVTTSGWLPVACLAIALLLDAGTTVTLDAAASVQAQLSHRPHLFMGLYATATDAGAASGPLIAYSLSVALGLAPIYLFTGGLLLAAALAYWAAVR